MKKISSLLSFVVIYLLFPAIAFAGNDKDITIIQDGKSTLLKAESKTLVLKKKEFAIRFFNQRYTEDANHVMQISAFVDRASLDKVQVGTKVEDIPFFGPGTGLAADDNGYSSLFLDSEAHHYIYYTDEQHKRAKLISEKKDILELEWRPHSFYQNEADTEFAAAGINVFYLVFLNDSNLNGVVDKGELKKVSIIFR